MYSEELSYEHVINDFSEERRLYPGFLSTITEKEDCVEYMHILQSTHRLLIYERKRVDMTPSLRFGGLPFFDASSKIEDSPYWGDLWTEVNGYKIRW